MANGCLMVGIIILETSYYSFSNLKFQLCQEEQKAVAIQVAAATVVVNHKKV
jgi:hypothetical protein